MQEQTTMTPRPVANGRPKPATDPNGGDDYKRHVEATFARYDAVLKERDALSAQLNTAINTLKQATDTEVLLRDEISSLRRQLEDSNLHTIQAMAERAAYETLFSGFMAQMREFRVPAVPLVRTASMDDGPHGEEGRSHPAGVAVDTGLRYCANCGAVYEPGHVCV